MEESKGRFEFLEVLDGFANQFKAVLYLLNGSAR